MSSGQSPSSDTPSYPTEAEPIFVGPHRFYMLSPYVQVVVYGGDVEVEHTMELMEIFTRYGGRYVAMIRDVERLGKFGAKARKVISASKLDAIIHPDATIRLYVANGGVAKRALIKLVTSLASVLSKTKVKLIGTSTMAEAIDKATRYIAEFSTPLGPPEGSPTTT